MAATACPSSTHRGNVQVSVPGYDAGPGYDLASGLGTIDAAVFILALVGI